jgi:hypothetical protein
VDTCMTQMERWKEKSGPAWRDKLWSFFVKASRKLSVVGGSV